MAFLEVAYLATALRLPLLLVLITPVEARLVAAALAAAPSQMNNLNSGKSTIKDQ